MRRAVQRQSNRQHDDQRAQQRHDPRKLLDQRHAGEHERQPHDDRPQHAPEQHAMLAAARRAERGEDHHEHKDIVKRQRPLDEISSEKLAAAGSTPAANQIRPSNAKCRQSGLKTRSSRSPRGQSSPRLAAAPPPSRSRASPARSRRTPTNARSWGTCLNTKRVKTRRRTKEVHRCRRILTDILIKRFEAIHSICAHLCHLRRIILFVRLRAFVPSCLWWLIFTPRHASARRPQSARSSSSPGRTPQACLARTLSK